MKSVDVSGCRLHILVCINQRHNSSMPACAKGGAEEVYEALRQEVVRRGLLASVWITRTQCLGWCHVDGTTLVFYPQGDWYRAVRPEDCSTLLSKYLPTR